MRGWTDEKLKAGFERFLTDHNRLPTAAEIDELDYLPASRTIQKRFGGLKSLRERLGYRETHFGAGLYRSAIAHEVGPRGRNLEIELEQELHNHFGARSVHTEKVFNGKQRVDFYVYSLSGNFAADVFFPGTFRTMQNNVNIKMKKYQHFTEPLYLVVANPDILQTDLDHYSINRREPFNENTVLLTYSAFLEKIKEYEPFVD